MNKCDYCTHVEMCAWRKEVHEDGCEFFDDGKGWIPCSERLPEDKQEILFSTKTGCVHSGRYHDNDSANQWYSHRNRMMAWNNVVTAWMPLPQPPKGD